MIQKPTFLICIFDLQYSGHKYLFCSLKTIIIKGLSFNCTVDKTAMWIKKVLPPNMTLVVVLNKPYSFDNFKLKYTSNKCFNRLKSLSGDHWQLCHNNCII